jgi:SAM-dependent methyltransferase
MPQGSTPHVCPWWIGYLLINPLRRLFQNPVRILGPYVRPGMTVLEPGPGMGFFTLDLARLVGPSGRVIAVDVQSRMLQGLRRRVAKADLLNRVETRLSLRGNLGVADLRGAIDMILAFAMVHELPDMDDFFTEAAKTLKPGGILFLAEPAKHVPAATFAVELESATAAGLTIDTRPTVRGSHAAVLRLPI